jgi:hypothetical protein
MARGATQHFQINGDKELIRQLRQHAETVIVDLAPVVQEAATEALNLAIATAPQEAEQGITVGETAYHETRVDKRDGLAVSIIGFDHPTAAYIHEQRTDGGPPNRFLRKAAARQRRPMTTALLSALRASLARTFTQKS